jgi:tRNA (guanine37-N1)-methyltransferase
LIFHVLTLFPQMIHDAVGYGVLGRAIQNGIVNVNTVDIRDYANNKHAQVDDAPYGGGAGMVMMAPPIFFAYQSLNTAVGITYLSPQGALFHHAMALRFSMQKEIVLLCGRYEGVDERVIEELVTEEVSIGDYVLSGGEPAALVFIDAVARLIPGVLGNDASGVSESFYAGGGLEYPQYTRPPVFNGRAVPDVLLSGHHKKVDEWRREKSLERTSAKRPDLI